MVKYVLPLLLLAPAPALAHTLYLFAQVRVAIVGRAYFPGNVAARQTDVIARDSSGRELGRTKTDDEGNFTLPADVRTDYHLTAETADGHSASFVVSAAEFPELRKQIDQPEHRLRLRDFLGGIGYILGLAGIALYMKARRKSPGTTSTSPN